MNNQQLLTVGIVLFVLWLIFPKKKSNGYSGIRYSKYTGGYMQCGPYKKGLYIDGQCIECEGDWMEGIGGAPECKCTSGAIGTIPGVGIFGTASGPKATRRGN